MISHVIWMACNILGVWGVIMASAEWVIVDSFFSSILSIQSSLASQ